MLLDFKNVLKKTDYDYLEASLTDAVRNRLKEKFVYREIEKSEWQAVAKQNFVMEEDLYTFTAAMNLGINAQPDVAIFGGFFIESKRGSSQQEIRTRVRILDLNERKEIADFEMKSVVDASIFETVEKIADRIANEAAAVLPGKEAWAKGEALDTTRKLNQLSLRGSLAPSPVGSQARTVSTGSQHGASDLRNIFSVMADFQHFGIYSESLGFFVSVGIRNSSDNFTFAQDGSPVPVSLLGLSTTAGFTWRQPLNNQLYAQPFFGGGMNYDMLKFAYNSNSVAVASTNGQALNQSELSMITSTAVGGIRLGYMVTRWLYIEIGSSYGLQFYRSGFGHLLSFDIGMGFKI
ncbi:hypothetical protein [Turneriella parva]|uniref:Uncharacterized protein n=1 Tax=Turneriella parva (strain ATCC BAA-1111 / DSM 21527 / NCTC 11395 / H) TaxID=869212 RepID=I4B6W5_TURPD|nr:hypothetical protein [Turneriella parva]AFM13022.1 hypothetical protein Turpa_2379 [Turneriella parva DSM 21527]